MLDVFFLLLLFSQSRASSSPDTDANASFEECHVHCFSFAV